MLIGDTNVPEGAVLHVQGPEGWTETFTAETVDKLVRMGVIHFVRTGHILQSADPVTGSLLPTGPVHYFYEAGPKV